MTLSNEEIEKYLDDLDKESKALKTDILKLCWYMRGSISYDEGMLLSHEDRELIGKIVKENLETTSESGLPFF